MSRESGELGTRVGLRKLSSVCWVAVEAFLVTVGIGISQVKWYRWCGGIGIYCDISCYRISITWE